MAPCVRLLLNVIAILALSCASAGAQDSELRTLLDILRSQLSQPDAGRDARGQFSAGGLTLGEPLPQLERPMRCESSSQFNGFTWCSGQVGAINRSVMTSADGRIVYANHSGPSGPLDVQTVARTLRQLSAAYGLSAHAMKASTPDGDYTGVIAYWGAIELQPLADDVVAEFANGGSPKAGLLVDFLIDLQRSARADLPIHRIGGGAGSIWVSVIGPGGVGKSRLILVDATMLRAPAVRPPHAADPSEALNLKRERDTAREQVAALQKRSDAAAQELAQIKQKLAESEGTVRRLVENNARTGREVDSEKANLSNTIEELKKSLERQTARMSDLERSALAQAKQTDRWRYVSIFAAIGAGLMMLAFLWMALRRAPPARRAGPAADQHGDQLQDPEAFVATVRAPPVQRPMSSE